MRHVSSPRRRNRGFSLVEIAMVLAIGALIISGVMLFYQNANMSLLANETQTELTVIVGAVHNLYSGVPDYAGLTDAIMYGSPDIPQKWKNAATGTLQSPYHMPLSMLVFGNAQLFITLHNVPRPVCMRLVTSDPGAGSYFAVGGAVPYYGGPLGAAFPVAMAEAACGYPMGSAADVAYYTN